MHTYCKELGNRLTGRYVPIELLPFSFKEFVQCHDEPVFELNRITTADHAWLQNSLRSYLQLGAYRTLGIQPKQNYRFHFETHIFRTCQAKKCV